MKRILVLLFCLASAGPAGAIDHHSFHSRGANWSRPTAITCETVRAYVSQVGVAQARALALANGMTPNQERRARRCLMTTSE
jgi:hypothetical protein